MCDINSATNSVSGKLCEAFSSGLKNENVGGRRLPSRDTVIYLLKELKKVLFPDYFEEEPISDYRLYAEKKLEEISKVLREQIKIAVSFENRFLSDGELDKMSDEICTRFISCLPEIRAKLEKDVSATFDGDPAAKSMDEIILSYPGILAIFTYRLAHVLYTGNVPLIPRIMTEYAHSRTGIDINAGAAIGENFVIDHGTGVVIGETTVIGNNVKIYQGVTLGALSTRKGQQLSGVKRHPTICNRVTIYSGASILGGETVIGEGAIIGGNAFITRSIPPHTKVIVKQAELILETEKTKSDVWEI